MAATDKDLRGNECAPLGYDATIGDARHQLVSGDSKEENHYPLQGSVCHLDTACPRCRW